jgi:hypothetical protein
VGGSDGGVSGTRVAGTWQARVLASPGTGIAGSGVVLDERTVLTCAHVVEAALRLPRIPKPPPGTVLVDFPEAGGEWGSPVRARVAEDGWLRSPPAGDLAVLQLEEPAAAVPVPAPAGRCGDRIGFVVSVRGNVGSVSHGLWARARVVGAGGTHPLWRQLDGLGVTGARIARGFSGAGVWDDARGQVIGLVTSVLDTPESDSIRVAWMIPLDVLDGTRFAILSPGNLPTEQERNNRLALHGAVWPLVDCLLTIESIASDGGAALLSLLPGRIAWGVPRHSRPRLQLLHIVRRCGEFEEGPAALLAALRDMEGETIAMTHFTRLAEQTWPDRLSDDG